MTAAQFDALTDASIRARIAAEPILAPCVCGLADDEPELERMYSWNEWHSVDCNTCARSIAAPTRAEAIKFWSAAMRHDALEAERAAWMKEAAMLLKACEDALWHTDGREDVDDGSDGQPMPNVFMKIASVLREAIGKATKGAT